MQIARLGADHLLDVGEERDHVVAGFGLDRLDPLRIDQRRGVALGRGAHLQRGLARHLADLRHRLERAQLDLEPQAQAMVRRPDRGHLGAGVARDHRGPSGMDRPVIAERKVEREVALPSIQRRWHAAAPEAPCCAAALAASAAAAGGARVLDCFALSGLAMTMTSRRRGPPCGWRGTGQWARPGRWLGQRGVVM